MAIELTDIIMDYPGTRALDRVSVAFRTDEVHGLIGENGAGKTTLVSILGGSRLPSEGRMTLDGEKVSLASPGEALARGIAHVSQEGSLVPSLTGAENILLGGEPRYPGGIVRRGALRDQARALLARWFPDLTIDLDQPVETLPYADQKIIEIVRALRGRIRILILDEPTATLPAREKERLWAIIRRLPAQGVGVVLISHFLSEIIALSDRITVLRDGRLIRTFPAAGATEGQLTSLMLQRGHGPSDGGAQDRRSEALGPPVVEVSDWNIPEARVSSFHIRAGEIVGLIGLTGSGHFAFARSLYDAPDLQGGTLRLGEETVPRIAAHEMRRRGVAFVPDHRMIHSLIGEWSARENLAMVHPEAGAYRAFGILSPRRESTEARAVMGRLSVKASSTEQVVGELSGGNKQKISIGKWLYGAKGRYRLMIFVEPTEGVDIGAKREIHDLLRGLAAEGTAILVASSDLIEIADLSTRVVSFVNGQALGDLAWPNFSEQSFIAAMSGARA
ncbi:sugar ABC transporter ATP-binding protein [Ancylobacter amanitiformis]|uniref:ABC-type sugar transport system ATPase subunit n=1 Tax=Ancylobacter amanitiformis TaxID=217069 RepID=A0ABU0LN08_9HYPH|nr:sugar ABC transporter ATP-binding protein [Ancylobacter amanitiformis]MDQ0510048.1 ABC-type sugar transport system ATPase subunit [Ancylobacter amanitiformis]